MYFRVKRAMALLVIAISFTENRRERRSVTWKT